MKILPVVEFEGKEIKPSRGVYYCPYGCGRSDYPKPSWKTEHLVDCLMSPSALAATQENQRKQREVEDLRREEARTTAERKQAKWDEYVKFSEMCR